MSKARSDRGEHHVSPDDVARTVMLALSQLATVDIFELLVLPTLAIDEG